MSKSNSKKNEVTIRGDAVTTSVEQEVKASQQLDMSMKDYHAHEAIGSSSLKTLANDSPARWLWEQENNEHKKAFDLGNMAHKLILEGSLDSIIRRVDHDNYMTKAAKHDRDMAINDGLIPINNTENERDLGAVYAMRNAVMDHQIAAQMVNAGNTIESSIFWEEKGVQLKCRPDSLADDVIWDLKTARSSKPKEFGKSAANLGYHQSAAHYQDGVQVLTGNLLPFRFVVVESAPPHFVSVIELDTASIGLGEELNMIAKANYRASVATNSWPAYPGLTQVSVPAWSYKAFEEDHLAEN